MAQLLDALLCMGTFLPCPQAVALAYAARKPRAQPSGISKVISEMSRDAGGPGIGINDFGFRVEACSDTMGQECVPRRAFSRLVKRGWGLDPLVLWRGLAQIFIGSQSLENSGRRNHNLLAPHPSCVVSASVGARTSLYYFVVIDAGCRSKRKRLDMDRRERW